MIPVLLIMQYWNHRIYHKSTQLFRMQGSRERNTGFILEDLVGLLCIAKTGSNKILTHAPMGQLLFKCYGTSNICLTYFLPAI